MATKTKPARLTSPAGTAAYAWLTKPDTKFNADGDYKTNLIVPEADAASFIGKLEELRDEYQGDVLENTDDKAKVSKLKKYNVADVYEEEMDEEGEPTGNVIFKFKQRAVIRPKGKDPFEKTVALFDAKGKKLSGVNPGGGSRIKVSFEPVGYCMDSTKTFGLSLRLNAVQVIELVAFGGEQNAEGYGFGEEEGFEFDGGTADTGTETEGEEANDTDGDF